MTGVDIMKKEQEAAQHKLDSAHVGNHVGSSNPPSHAMDNHVPHHAGSKSLLAKVGLGSESDKRSSVVASALALAGVDSAIVGGGQAAMAVRNVPAPRGGADGGSDSSMRTSKTVQSAAAYIAEPVIEKRETVELTKLPPSMTSPSTTTPPKKKEKESGGARRGETPRFSQLLTPLTILDHFDQYHSGHQPPTVPSGGPAAAAAGSSDFPGFSYDNRPTTSNEPASARDSRSRAIQRRKTLPGRPPGPLLIGAASNPGHRAPAPTLRGDRENEAISFVAAAAAATATAASAVPVYRKPAAVAAPPPPARPTAVGGGSGARLKKASGGNRGSMPDVSECASVAATGVSPSMPREEVHVLSLLRREELRRLREEAARRHQQDIVLRLGDIKEWCQERQLLVLVIALNISLATVFFNLLTH